MDEMDEAFQREQEALAAMVKRVGWDALPLNDDSLRPFLAKLWDAGASSGMKVWSFDRPDQGITDRLYHGLIASRSKLEPVAQKLQTELMAIYSREEIARALPIFNPSKPAVLYFEGVWTPKSAFLVVH